MPRPVLNFLDFAIDGVSCVSYEDYKPEVPQRAQVQFALQVQKDPEDPFKFIAGLDIRVFKKDEDQDANAPYQISFGIMGQFRAIAPLDAAMKVPVFFAHNAVTLLYGAARGVVFQITAGGANGRFVLPTVAFDNLVSAAAKDPESGVEPDNAEYMARVGFKPVFLKNNSADEDPKPSDETK